MMRVNIAARMLAVKRELSRAPGRIRWALDWSVQSQAAHPGRTGGILSLRDGLWHGSLRFVCGLPDFGGLGFKVANC